MIKADRAIEELKALPMEFEKKIAQWKKKMKDLEKDHDTTVKQRENLLKQFLDT